MKKDINIFLDLDNTLIWSLDIDKVRRDDVLLDKFKNYEMKDNYIIFERPGLQKFLKWIFKHFNVSIWSAASPVYVEFIAKNIVERKNRRLDYVLNANNCEYSQKVYGNSHIKQLDLLWDRYDLAGYSKMDTLIIDDLVQVVKGNPDNSLRIKKFIARQTSINDQDLDRIKSLLIKIKKNYYKNINKKNFKLKCI
jgi:hypothetical protein